MKKIIDTFLFMNEIDLLKVRLSYLRDQVDIFFIVEANCDFSGKKKPFNLEEKLHEMPFADKIIYHKLEIDLNSPTWVLKRLRWLTRKTKFLWKIQDVQRNQIKILIRNYPLNYDYILFGDLDEIPNKNFLIKLKAEEISLLSPFVLRQRCFYYNTRFASIKEDWLGTLCIPRDMFFEKEPSVWRHRRENFYYQAEGGFHFSYFMTPYEIKEKINAIAEVEKLEEYLNLQEQEIAKLIFAKQDLYGRNLGFKNQNGLIPADLSNLIKHYLPYLICEE